jgi:hypothetical protein
MAYKPGDNFVACDRCGFRKYASECRKQWDGWFVCKDCYDDKHPSLEPHALKSDRIKPKEVRQEKYYFIEPPEDE